MKTLLALSTFLLVALSGRANVVTLEIYYFNQPLQNVTVSVCDTLVIMNLSSTMSYSLCEEADGSPAWPPSAIIANMASGTATYFYLDNLTPYSHLSVLHQVSNLVFFITITPVPETIVNATICQGASYTLNGQEYTEPGTYSQLYASAASCDSLVTLHLDVLPPTNSWSSTTICPGESIVFEDSVYTVPGTYVHLYQTANGCDSIHTLVLDQFSPIDVTITQVDANTLYAASPVTIDFEWVDCNDNFTSTGATGTSFTPQQNGFYAVIATENSCTDTSECLPISAIGLEEHATADFSVFPVPATETITLQADPSFAGAAFYIVSPAGAVVLNGRIQAAEMLIDIGQLARGVYYLQIVGAEGMRKIVRATN